MKKIGIFDSGIGGLMIAKQLAARRPKTDIFYIADDQFNPYGALTEKEILDRSIYCTERLIKEGVELIAVACNTATAASIKFLRENYPIEFVGVEPDLNFPNREILKDLTSPRVGVLMTSYTFQSKKFLDLKKRRDPLNKFIYFPMENLATLIEQFYYDENCLTAKKEILKELSSVMRPEQFDYIVLGCTHYEYIKLMIEDFAKCECVCPSDAVAKRIIKLGNLRCADSYLPQLNYLSTKKNVWEDFSINKLKSWPK